MNPTPVHERDIETEGTHVPCLHCKVVRTRGEMFFMGDRPFCDLSHYLKWTRSQDRERGEVRTD